MKKRKKRQYKLKVSKECHRFFMSMCRKHKIVLSYGSRKEFEIDGNGGIQGFAFQDLDDVSYIYINPKQFVGGYHDLVVLHELGHILLFDAKIGEVEEYMASGYAIATAKHMGFKTNRRLIRIFKTYNPDHGVVAT